MSRQDNIQDSYPLSPIQEGMLFHSLSAPEADGYLSQLSCRMTGELDVAAFERAWQAVVDRHTALRTAFVWQNVKQPLQVVGRQVGLPLETLDWRGVPAAEVPARLDELLRQDVARGLKLGRAPLMRLTLVRLDERSHHFIWLQHHLILDGWSHGLIFGEVFACYDAFRRGADPRLTPAAPFRDFIGWLRRQSLPAAEDFWRRKLAGVAAPTPIPVGRPLGGAEGHGLIERRLDAGDTGTLESWAREHRLTSSTLVQGAWAQLLARYSGEDEVLFGTVVSGRPAALPGVEGMVGLFINTLPARVRVSAGDCLVPWLQRLQDEQSELRQYEHTPLAAIQKWSGLAPGRPLFESSVAFQNLAIEQALAAAAGEVEIDGFRTYDRPPHPLSLVATPGRELILRLAYDAGRFPAAAMERMLGHLVGLLLGFVRQGDRPLEELPLLTPEERGQVLVEWNRTAAEYPRDVALHRLFERQAAATPEAPAVIAGGRPLTYRELDARANRLARHLRRLGAGPEMRVGLCVERSLPMTVGILAILKAGAAFVPLDPANPRERLAFLLEDCGAALLLTRGHFLEGLDGLPPAAAVPVLLDGDGLCEAAAELDGGPLPGEVPAESAAYLIYTSGSTGRPKGVLVPHRPVAGYALEMVRRLGLGPDDRVLQFAALGFDVIIEELFPAWLAGAAVVLHERDLLLDAGELDAVLADNGVTGVELPAAFWQEWVRALSEQGGRPPASLRWVIVGSEKPAAECVAAWRRWGVPMIYIFGLTETTVTSTLCPVEPGGEPREDGGDLPIGRPVANTRIYVLDRWGSPAPVAVDGELWIGGEGLARGYHGRPGLTAERFLPDPFAAEPGLRLYRTGDRVRYRESGELDFLGRLDEQVKVRGFRIEPGEVEAALRALDGVRDAVVVARPMEMGQRLVAYVVPAGGGVDPSRLRQELRRRLPEHMVPSAFVSLSELPLTPHGKVDRRALPDPAVAAAGVEGERGYVPPRTERERVLAGIWSEVLGVERVGAEDNFFELGGDSILTIQVVARAHRAGIRLNPRQLFEHPTVAGLARLPRLPVEAAPVRAEQGVLTGPAPLLPIQAWFFAQEPEEPWHFNQSLPLELRAPWPVPHLAAALATLYEHHDALRLRFQRGAGGWEQSYAAPDGGLPLGVIDLSALPETRRGAAVEAAGARLQASLDLGRGPLLRAALFVPAGDGARLLLLACHHLVVDRVSWEILVGDLVALCDGLGRGEAPALPAKTTSVREWATRLREKAVGEGKNQLEPRPSLPVDFPQGANTVGSARPVRLALEEDETRALLQEVPRAYRTRIDDVLLTALAFSLGDWTGEPLALVDLEGHGRDADGDGVDLSRTVGWLTVLYPVLLDLRSAASPGAALKAVKESLRAAPRRLGSGAEVIFNYAGQLDQALPAGGPVALSRQPVGPAQSPRARRSHLLEVNAGVSGGRLELAFTFSESVHRAATVERLAEGFRARLRELIAHCASPEAGGYTPSDFPLARLEQEALDRLLAADREVEDLYPLSPLQEGMLFHALYAPDAGVYMAQMVCDLEGEMDASAFAAAWQEVVDRQPVLRTSFHWQGLERPLQKVRSRAVLPWAEEDWRGLSPEEREGRLAAFLEQDRARGFDLSTAPLTRLLLLRTGEASHRLVWSFHQIMMDGWSLPLLFREVLTAYAERRSGREALIGRGRPYRDYIAWLLDRGPSQAAQAEAYWRQALAGFSEPTALSGDGAPVSGERRDAELLLPAEPTAGVLTLARRCRVTLNTVVQAAWALLLGRSSGVSDVVFGATVAGRPAELEGVESMVGLFINTLPVRVELPEAETVRRWLGALQDRQAETRRLEWAPLAQIQRWSELPGRSLFDSFVVFQNYPLDRGALAAVASGLEVAGVVSRERSHYPLTLVVRPEAELSFHLAYDPAYAEPVAVARLLDHLRNLLQGLAADPERPLGEVQMLGEGERHQLLVEWSDTGRPMDRVPVHRRFEEQARRTPEEVAVLAAGEGISYAGLDRRANRLARHLRALGVGPETRVGLSLERSAAMVAAILGIFKAGGVLVPLDPAYPAERLAFMLEETEASVLLTEEELLARSPGLASAVEKDGLRVCRLDAEAPVIAARAGEPLDDGPEGHHLAYLLFTSGTTGRPKAVQVEHRHLAHTLAFCQEEFGFGPGDAMPFLAPFSFDISFFEWLAPLLAGGTSLVLDREEVLDLERLAAAVAGATALHGVPSLLRRLVSFLRERNHGPIGLRQVFVGGDFVPSELLADLLEVFPRARVVVLYGPTESTIVCSWYGVPRDGGTPRGLLGRPFGNVELRVVDGGGRPVPIGVPGELWVGGAGVTRGYLRRPELTAERFVVVEGERFYRTGDRVRRLPDGNLEFVGRADDQVKIRGFRIELGEIEAALGGHPALRQAVVAPRRSTLGEQRLVAWVVPKEEAPNATELHRFLEERLPEHMIPAAFVPLAELPLTAHGKVDRRSLPDPGESRPDLETGFVAPRGEVEARLAAIWRAVLGVERVGVHDDFFELGGDSILSIQIVAKANQAGLRLTPRQIFEHPTVAGLAPHAGVAPAAEAEQGLVTGPVALTPVQRRFFSQERQAPHWFALSLLLDTGRAVAAPRIERALGHLLAHHDALRLRFVHGEQILAGDAGALRPPAVARVDLSGLPAETRAAALEQAGGLVQASLDLERGPLVRAALFGLGEPLGERLLLAVHHLAVDAVSWRILLEDLRSAYEQERLPAKTTSFQRWAAALVEHARSEAVAAQIPYWTAAAGHEVRPLPVDLPGGANLNSSARLVAAHLSAEETRSLLAAVPEAYRAQVQDALLTALARCLSRWTGGGPVRVDLEGHGREEIGEGLDLSRTVGWFTTVYPVLLDAGPGDIGAALAAIKEQLRAVPGRGLGYGLLRYLREDGAGLADLPDAELGFNYLGRLDQAAGDAPLLKLARESAGPSQSPAGPRGHLLEVNSQILDGRLEVEWSYSESVHRRETVEALAAAFLEDLRGLIAHCASAEAGAYTPSDFPLLDAGQSELEALLAGLGGPEVARPRSRALEEVYPLSPTQEGMLFHTLLAPEAYFEQVSARLAGPLDAAALRQAWQRAVERHPVLRTAVVWQRQDRPVQVVYSRVELPWEEEDWRALPADERRERLAAFLRADRERGVDLARAPLLRLRLIRLEEEAWQFVWSHHHLLLDAWSRSRLFQEVVGDYEALRRGGAPELPRSRPYRDYIAWLRRQDPGRAEELWRRVLAGFTGPTPFGVDRGAGADAADSAEPFGKLEVRVPEALARGLGVFARRHRLTEQTVIQGAWGLLLSRYGGEPDVVFGNVVAGRPADLPGVDSMIGLFINTLPVRVRVSPEESAGRWLAGLQAEQVEARQYEHTPLSRILRWSGGGPGRPLFESLFVYQNASLEPARGSAASFRIAAIDVAERTDYPVTVTAEPGDGLALRVEYDRRRFEPVVARRMLDHLANLLAGLTDPADRPLQSLELLSAAERHQLVLEWNATGAAPPAAATLPGLFAASVARHGDEIAVVAGEKSLTYRELDRLTDGVAARLRAAGAGPEGRVAICAGHSLALAAGILGILKAGGAYVPLDPAYPPARLAYMLEDSGASLVLAESRHAAAVPPSGVPVILFAEEQEGGASDRTDPTDRSDPSDSDSAAYVIYTSGSTGQPKAAVVAHRPLAVFAWEMAGRLGLGPGDRILQFASPSFDVVLEELFPAWAAGAAVVLHDGDLLSIPHLEATIAAHGVTGLELPAAYWQEWVYALAGSGRPLPESLRFVIVGAEKPRPERVARWLSFGPPLVYVFGLTETAVTSSLHVARPDEAADESACDLPIGRPIAGSRFYVLDPEGRPLPAGAVGELFIGGAGLGRGYLGRPGLTAERFVPDPFGGESGARLYRTGDRARLRLDGRTDFLGRLDQQVKVRGFRIEPAEIEAALVAHPEIREAVVLARDDAKTGRRLVAYLVPVPDSALESAPEVPWEELRAFLARSLPEHMLPQVFVTLPALPLTPNGKVDRRALPAPEGTGPARGRTAPRDVLEGTLARIWSEVLGLESVGVDDDFFELGGDSILSIQVTSRAQRAGIGLTPRQIFEAPTIARLARLVGSAGASTTGGAEQGPVAGPVPLTPIQHWFFDRQPAEPHHFNLPVLLAPRRRLEPGVLAGAVRRLLEHHDALRLRFERGAQGWSQHNAAPDGAVPFTSVDLSALPAPRRGEAMEGACARLQGSLDLARGPLLRTALLELEPGVQRLFLACHHLAVDTVSLHVLVEDLAAAYDALSRGRQAALPPKTTSFRRWAELLTGWAIRPEIQTDARYWLQPGFAVAPALPRDADGEDLEATAETLGVELDEEETRALLQQVPRPYRARVDEVLLAALAEAAGAWTGRRVLLVDLEGHGRDGVLGDVDLSRTVGWFATLHPVLLDLRQALGPAELLKAAKEQMRAVPRRGASFGLLRHLGAPAMRDRLARVPRAEVLFNYLGQLDQGGGEELPFALAAEPVGPAISPRAERTHALEVNAGVTGGRLRVSFTYGPGRHRRSTIAGLAEGFLASLRALMAHCLSPEAGGYTPSDFPLARLDQRGVDRLLGRQRGIEDVYPLSPLQKGMLFHILMEPEEGQYLGQLVCELHGPLHRAAFRAAWQNVLDRHAALRTGLRWEELAEPLQVVYERVRLPLEVQDWSAPSAPERERRLASYLEDDRRRGVLPSAAPPMRLLLARTAEDSHLLVWTFLQTSLDGWSLPLLFDEVLTGYEAFARGQRPRLDPAPSYRGYIDWLARQDAGGAEAFWRRCLAGVTGATALPGAPSREARPVEIGEYREAQLRLSAAHSAGLQALARRHGLTLNTLMQGTWALLLARHAPQDRPEGVVFGAAVSGRPPELPGVDATVGLFLNTLPVHARVRPEAELLAWLRDLQAEQAEVRQYEYVPLNEVQRWSEVPAGRPLFETLLVVENYPVAEAVRGQRGALEVRGLRTLEKSSYPLTAVVNPGERIGLTLSYYGAWFDAVRIGRLLARWEALLAALVADPEARLEELGALPGAERHQLLVEWNDSGAVFASETLPVHRQVAEHAARNPSAIAVEAGGRTLTYGQLQARAGRLARLLRRRGVGPETLVGVCFERSPELLVALLGVLQAGGAYLPLDPDYPDERLALLLDDSRAPVLVTRAGLLGRLSGYAGEILCLDAADAADGEPETVTPLPDAGGSLAYAIYTSGSTGRPKGVLIEHAGLLNLVRWHRQVYGVGPADRATLVAAPGFDASVWEIWPYLTAGASLHIPDETVRTTPASLVAWLAREAVTLSFLPTPLAEAALQEPWPHDTILRALLTGGDRLHRGAPPRAGFRLINHYGPTEITVVATCGDVPPAAGLAEPPSIGRPIANVRVYVLDETMAPVPLGAAGELYLSGTGLSRGYLHAPALTAERFVPDPLGGSPGGRLYRTGDLVRYHADGRIDFLGRADHQVKVRGFRVELGEVEAALRALPGVREAAAALREEASGERRLVGYLVTGHDGDGAPMPAAELRERLRGGLPEYMVPAAFVRLDALPLNPHGKVDRRALPAPEPVEHAAGGGFAAPVTPVEQRLAAIWQEVLGVPQVGLHDDFFSLGGDSILAIQLVARANQAGIQLNAKQVMESPTVAQLAALQGNGSSVLLAEQGPVTGPVALLPIQRWFFEDFPADPHHANQALLLESRRRLDPGLLMGALGHLLLHHDALRLRFRPSAEGWQQVHAAPGEEPSLLVLDLSALPEAAQGPAITTAAAAVQTSLDLGRGPLLRAALFELGGARPGRLLLVAHHLVVDGVSWRILLEDLETAYERLEGHHPVMLRLKTTSYRQWSERLVSHVASGALAEEADYWAAGLPWEQVRPLPLDRPGGENTVVSESVVEVALTPEQTTALLQELPEVYGVQINDVLLTALAQAFHGWTGGALLVDIEGHGREQIFKDIELSRTVGWFTTLYPIVLSVGGVTDAGAALERVKEELRRIPGRGIGFGMLRYLAKEPRLASLPRPEVSFNYLGQLDQALPASTPFTLARESAGPARSRRARRRHILDVTCQVLGGRLGCELVYSVNLHRRETVQALADAFAAALRGLLAPASTAETAAYKPADFPLMSFSQEELDDLLNDASGVLKDR